MIRISVLYPNGDGATFDHDYYANNHMALVREKLSEHGLVRVEVDKGLAGGQPDAPAPFVAAGYLFFASIADFQAAFGVGGADIMADVPNYTNIEPQIQISEITVEQ